MENFYGEFWYKKFFNNYHLSNSIEKINKNKLNKSKLMGKYGSEWFSIHLDKYSWSKEKNNLQLSKYDKR